MGEVNLLTILGVIIATLVGSLVANIVYRKKERLEQKESSNKDNEQLLLLLKEALGAEKREIRVDLEGKKSAINDMISEIRRDLRRNEERLLKTEEERIKTFSSLKQELESYKKITGDLKLSADKLKNLLSNNQMRGAFGEQVAENLLKMAGFVIGQDYICNEAQETKNTRPDFTIFLPDKTKINIDVKFPYSSLVKYVEAEEKTEKEKYKKLFESDVKTKIKQVSTRDYINPEERTVDFVILFIPNEMIFSFIYDKMNNVWEEAMNKKVILAGPFSFTAILRMVKQAYTNFRYQENLQQIIGLIQKFDSEYQKFSEEVDKLGDRITSASRQFDTVATTRNRQLTSVVDKIKDHKISDRAELADEPIKILK